jgi:hypothetical protein
MSSYLRKTIMADGVVHIRGALDMPTLDEALRCWQWSIDHSSPLANRLFPNGGVPTQAAKRRRSLSLRFFWRRRNLPVAAKSE